MVPRELRDRLPPLPQLGDRETPPHKPPRIGRDHHHRASRLGVEIAEREEELFERRARDGSILQAHEHGPALREPGDMKSAAASLNML